MYNWSKGLACSADGRLWASEGGILARVALHAATCRVCDTKGMVGQGRDHMKGSKAHFFFHMKQTRY